MQLNRLDDAQLVAETAITVDPKNQQVKMLLENLKQYKRQQRKAGASVNKLGSATAPTLTAAQAETKAVELANAKAQELYSCQPFQKGRPAELVDGKWVWHDGRAHGAGDMQATVKFAADGTSPEVKVVLLDSRLRPMGTGRYF